jgi:hypothetical protein
VPDFNPRPLKLTLGFLLGNSLQQVTRSQHGAGTAWCQDTSSFEFGLISWHDEAIAEHLSVDNREGCLKFLGAPGTRSLDAMFTKCAKQSAFIFRMTLPRCAFTVISLIPCISFGLTSPAVEASLPLSQAKRRSQSETIFSERLPGQVVLKALRARKCPGCEKWSRLK